MTKATLIVHVEPDPVVVHFDVDTDDKNTTIEINPGGVKIHTPNEPKVVTT